MVNFGPGCASLRAWTRQPIEQTPTRPFQLSKDLPHDWSEQRQFLGFGSDIVTNSRPERFITRGRLMHLLLQYLPGLK